jgi:hypothetical protein
MGGGLELDFVDGAEVHSAELQLVVSVLQQMAMLARHNSCCSPDMGPYVGAVGNSGALVRRVRNCVRGIFGRYYCDGWV